MLMIEINADIGDVILYSYYYSWCGDYLKFDHHPIMTKTNGGMMIMISTYLLSIKKMLDITMFSDVSKVMMVEL
jgi:hypothetical protein